MAEMDVLERRVVVALLAHVGEIPDAVDAAAVARRVALEHPRRRAFRVGWRPTAVPLVVWALLLVALLVAMGAEVLVVGSRPQPELPVVAPPVGQVFACPPGSTPSKAGPVNQARPAGGVIGFDRQAGRLVAIGSADGVETWTFDVCRNTWTEMHPDRQPSSFGWGTHLVYDVDSDLTIGVSSGKVWAYDLQADTWTEKGVTPIDATLWDYDAVSGLVIAAKDASPFELWNYDVETDTWTPIHQVNGPANVQAFAYDASVDRFVAYAAGLETWLFDVRTGLWSRSDAVTPFVASGMAAPNIVYDETAERTVVFGNGRLATYDATADRWEILIEPGPLQSWQEVPLCMVYDAVNRRLLGCGYGEDDAAHQANVIQAFDVANREWTLLLGPDRWRSAPSAP